MAPHQPSYHILDNTFAEKDQGLTVPERRNSSDTPELLVCRTANGTSDFNTIECRGFLLQISNLDRSDPPGYQDGVFPRAQTFNNNSGKDFRITTEPRMPQIKVQCTISGFEPADVPIYWRLRCRHVLCRHWNVGGVEPPATHGPYRYRGQCEVLDDEWQGKSRKATFTLFQAATDPDIDYDYNSNDVDAPVMGGHAILEVAALPPSCSVILRDYVHLRIAGNNPAKADVLSYIDRELTGRDANIVHMVKAVAAHESGFKQFLDAAQTRAVMHFVQKHHQNNPAQPDCTVTFDFPDDPDHFPNVSFDWGVGILQYTKLSGRVVGRETVWDWRASVRRGMNEFLEHMRHKYQANIHWNDWAHKSWKAYNGSGPQAEAYANTLAGSSEGAQVSQNQVLANFDFTNQTKNVADPPAREAPPSWPPFTPPGDYQVTPMEEVPV